MKIDTNAFLDSLPIMGAGLLGIFIVTAVIIIGIYLLKAVTSKSSTSDDTEGTAADEASEETQKDRNVKKESAMDLMKEREKKDFLDEVENNYISHDL